MWCGVQCRPFKQKPGERGWVTAASDNTQEPRCSPVQWRHNWSLQLCCYLPPGRCRPDWLVTDVRRVWLIRPRRPADPSIIETLTRYWDRSGISGLKNGEKVFVFVQFYLVVWWCRTAHNTRIRLEKDLIKMSFSGGRTGEYRYLQPAPHQWSESAVQSPRLHQSMVFAVRLFWVGKHGEIVISRHCGSDYWSHTRLTKPPTPNIAP